MVATRPRLSLCMIVRDNKGTIRPCLESIRPWVDEMIVVDTGSRDSTPEIASQLGASVSHFPWCDDFSTARNVSLNRAHGEWLFWMDSDDTIPPDCGRQLRETIDGCRSSTLGHVVHVHCPAGEGADDDEATVVDHVKLIRNHPRIRFEGRIHEQILPSIRALGGDVGWTDAFVVHSGSDQSPEGKQRKYERDLRLLELDLAERPNHPFVLFNFGMTYNDMGRHQEAISWLDRCVAVSATNESHLRKAYALWIASLHALRQYDEAERLAKAALDLFPRDVELHFRRGITAHASDRLEMAIQAYRSVLSAKEERHFTSIDRGLTGYKVHHNLALAYQDLGELIAAEQQFRRSIAGKPTFTPSWRGLIDCLLRRRALVSAAVEIDRMEAIAKLRPEALVQRAALARQKEETNTALKHLYVARAEYPENLEVLENACRVSYELEAFDDARSWLTELVERRPDDASARHNLGNVQLRTGNVGQAVGHLECAHRLRPESPTTRELLACAYAASGRHADAARVRTGLSAMGDDQ